MGHNISPAAGTPVPGEPLPALPRELWGMVGGWADKGTLKALRLVSRDISFGVDDQFRHRFFAYRQHLLTDYSLDALECIVETPRLRRSIDTLCLVFLSEDRFTDITDREDTSRVPIQAFAQITGILNTFASHKLSPRLELLNSEERQDPHEFVHLNDWSRFEEKTKAFGEEEVPRRPRHRRLDFFTSLYSDDNGVDELDEFEMSGCNIPYAFLWSISSSRFEVTQLRLTINHEDTAAAITRSARLTALLGSSTITSLDLGVPLDDDFDPEVFTNAMQSNNTLEKLTLRSYRDHGIGQVADAFSTKKLQSITIIGSGDYHFTTTCENDIKRFLMPHRETLRHIEFYDCSLDGGSWVSTWENLRNHFALSSLLFSGLEDGAGEQRNSCQVPSPWPHLRREPFDIRHVLESLQYSYDAAEGWDQEYIFIDWVSNVVTTKVLDHERFCDDRDRRLQDDIDK